MVRVPTEKRYEEHIERELNSLLDDGLQFHSKVHQRDDTWYDKESCVVGDEFIEFIKGTQKETYDILQKKYGENTHKNILKRLNKEIDNKGLICEYYSENKKESTLPLGFWVLSIGGSILILSYAIFRSDPVLFIGHIIGTFIYSRNIYIYLKFK